MLVDKEGRIVFKGHPAERPNLEQDLDDLAAGKALTGKGAWSGDSAKEEEGGVLSQEGFKELDLEAVNKEIDGLLSANKDIKADQRLKDNSAGLMRAFNVLVLEQRIMPSGKATAKYQNYRVLMGKQDAIDKVKPVLEEHMKGTFEVNEQIQGM